MKFLLDTNIISEIWRRNPESNVVEFLNSQDDQALAISAMTVAELRYGAARHPDLERRSRLGAWIDTTEHRFSERILPFDAATAYEYGIRAAYCDSLGRQVPTADLIIASTAIVHDLTLVTRNDRHFAPVGVRMLNPWPAGAN